MTEARGNEAQDTEAQDSETPQESAGQESAGQESEAQSKARKEREKEELYALDISDAEWQSAPGTEADEERVEIAHLPAGAVAMRSSLDPETVLRYTEAEWQAFVLGARDGEFDLEPSVRNGGLAAE